MFSSLGRYRSLAVALAWGAVLGWPTSALCETSAPDAPSEARVRNDFCSYGILQRHELRETVLAGFPAGISEEDARRQMALHVPAEQIGEFRLPQKGSDGKLLQKNGVVVLSGARLLWTKVVCDLPHGNRNVWRTYLLIDENGHLAGADFYVAIDDHDFAKRGIPLLAEYVYGEDTIARAIDSIARERFKTWPELESHLLDGGFTVRPGTHFVMKTEYPDRLWYRLVGADGIAASVAYDADGNYLETK